MTRKVFLEKLADSGYEKEELATLQLLVEAEESDLFDVFEYITFAVKPITRQERVTESKSSMFYGLNSKEIEFLEFVLSKYVESGVEELNQEKLPSLLLLKYHSISDAIEELGGVEQIQHTFISSQKYLYARKLA
jgi:type I restriction enzyme R subunit